jgi:cytochrome c biogenesis factor
VVALFVAGAGVLPIVGAARDNAAWMAAGAPAAQAQFVFVAIAFGCLMTSFINNDFSVLYVASQLQQRCRWPTASPPSGVATKARCCCGC